MMSGRGRIRSALRGALFTMAATAVAVLGLQSPSMADENWLSNCSLASDSCQTGVEVSGPQGECLTASAGRHNTVVCVDYSGDYVYVKDGSADTYSAMASVWSDNNNSWRHCRNTHGNGTWARCNFDWPESGDHHVLGGYRISSTDTNTMLLWRWSGK